MDAEGAVGLLRDTWRKLDAVPTPDNAPSLRWKLVVIITDSVLRICPEAVLGVFGVVCTTAGAIHLGQKWSWMHSGQVASRIDIKWVLLYAMYALGVILILGVLHFVFLLPHPEHLRLGWTRTVPVYALLVIGVSIAGVFSSMISESTIRTGDPELFRQKETQVPATNRRLLFLHGIVGLAVAFAILLVM